MKTYPEWERVVLEHTYEVVDHISLHMYFANPTGHTQDYLSKEKAATASGATPAPAPQMASGPPDRPCLSCYPPSRLDALSMQSFRR